MRPQLSQGQIRPQISTMPRQKTEAAAYLDIYKLVNERTRLQKELESLSERRDRVEKRLEVLNSEVAKLEITAHQLRDGVPLGKAIVQPPAKPEDFNTFLFEY
ncbi:hypothetical protein [Stenomitos frigidus]|uniref:Gas vesicle protein n=1 Tax=Stenomitos frigidus ULC18 TaxID=2107698 RepID=A0A2T1DYP0_9CYAN|nr:hypothetical protein [Stenomitos frigidus]PSB25627.1 hypothetical protein C7B82_22680 [Stenomitos frigidus ULC18]